jgi:hypothetical protein
MVRDKMDHTSNLSNLGFMNCQTKVVILDLNCDFRLIKKNYDHKTKLLDILIKTIFLPQKCLITLFCDHNFF